MVLAALSQAIEARDPYTRGHSERVSVLAQALARRLGWKSSRLGAIKVGALLHDVGKLNLDDAVLRKPGPLDEREFREIKRHPLAGARLIRGIEAMRPALPYILFHHERWDGAGYPSGRSREQIPLGARIVAVVDAFDAMISMRPYRPPLPIRKAVEEVQNGAGTQFDPGVVRAFIGLWREGELDRFLPDERLSA
ncbi:MAG TPA: HD-GYP domain-containing protein [Gaiellaceae bacterium]|nr:HD-GYP domain-containing protein [Gaiellaceae bacterium]